MKSLFLANSSISYPLYLRIPLSPSIYVIFDSHEAVDVNPGSYVNIFASACNLEISITASPSVELYIGNS